MVPSKSLMAFFLVMACLEVKLSAENIAPVEVASSSQDLTKILIGQLDQSLTEVTQRFPDNITDDEFQETIESSFQKFYAYITATKPKAQVHAIIMYLQYAELIFKHGATSKQLQIKDSDTKEQFFFRFLLAWENMLSDALEPITDSLYDVITNQKTKEF